MRRSEILQTLAARREDLTGMGVKSMAIFGSVARDEARPDSDVDVLVTFRKNGETFSNYMECKFYLEDLFGRKVDLVMKGAIKKRLKPYILGEVVYA